MSLHTTRRDDPERTMRLPRCGVCGLEVEAVDFDEDEVRDKLIVTARCHGARERVVIDGRELRGSVDCGPGVAFRDAPRLAP